MSTLIKQLKSMPTEDLKRYWESLSPEDRASLMRTLNPKPAPQSRTIADKLGDRERHSRARTAGQDIGQLAPCRDPERRMKARWSLAYHLQAYHPSTFNLKWASYHYRLIELTQKSILEGGWFACAVPRGGGKTKICEGAVEWALVHGHKRYPVLVGATTELAEESLDSLKKNFLSNHLLLEDFPEVCYPIAMLDDESRRAAGQICVGARTRMVWGKAQVVFPTIPQHEYDRWSEVSFGDGERPVDVSGSRFRALGLTGSFRGMSATTAKLASLRPDLAVCDDPQTRESARSLIQSKQRLAIIRGDVAYLAGPQAPMSILAPCTVIYRGDLADQILDRVDNPEFHGERHKMLESFPTNMEMWDRYAEIYRESLRLDEPVDRATQYYLENQEAMDEGAVVSWPERHPGAETAVEYSMRLRIRDPHSFAAEAQNEPESDADAETIYAPASVIIQKQHHLPRFQVPLWATQMVAHIDVQQRMLYYAVCAASQEFEVACIDYGTFPQQNRRYFSYSEDLYDLEKCYGGLRPEEQVYLGLLGAFKLLTAQDYVREDGLVMDMGLILVDVGFMDATVLKACRQAEQSDITIPAKGYAVRAKEEPMSRRKWKPGDEVGHEWVIRPNPQTKRTRQLTPNVNYWKTQVHAGFLAPAGPGSLTLWKDEPERHRMIADHCNGEYPTRVTANERSVDEWSAYAHRPDNHLLDNLVGCLAGLSVRGCELPSAHDNDLTPRRRERRKFSGRNKK